KMVCSDSRTALVRTGPRSGFFDGSRDGSKLGLSRGVGLKHGEILPTWLAFGMGDGSFHFCDSVPAFSPIFPSRRNKVFDASFDSVNFQPVRGTRFARIKLLPSGDQFVTVRG